MHSNKWIPFLEVFLTFDPSKFLRLLRPDLHSSRSQAFFVLIAFFPIFSQKVEIVTENSFFWNLQIGLTGQLLLFNTLSLPLLVFLSSLNSPSSFSLHSLILCPRPASLNSFLTLIWEFHFCVYSCLLKAFSSLIVLSFHLFIRFVSFIPSLSKLIRNYPCPLENLFFGQYFHLFLSLNHLREIPIYNTLLLLHGF